MLNVWNYKTRKARWKLVEKEDLIKVIYEYDESLKRSIEQVKKRYGISTRFIKIKWKT